MKMNSYYQANEDEETLRLIHSSNLTTLSKEGNDNPVIEESSIHSIELTTVVDQQDLTPIQKRVTYFSVMALSFLLSFYFVFTGIEMILFKGSLTVSRRLDEAPTTEVTTCTWKDGAIVTVTGAAVGAALVLGGFALIGLSPAGPVAGGWFASNMGAGLVSGSWMSLTQSAAMTGTAYGTGAAVGAVSSAFAACKIIN